jgi:hypothetical protein|tara:strand:+ start:2229 stop:2396 length:168 start_codon:yes stop_codon:yes gene_type:complete
MGRLEKLKKENIKKVNKLLDDGHKDGGIKEKIVLKPSENVTSSPQEFINKMDKLI